MKTLQQLNSYYYRSLNISFDNSILIFTAPKSIENKYNDYIIYEHLNWIMIQQYKYLERVNQYTNYNDP